MQTARIDGPGSEKDQARFYAKVALPNEQGCMLWTAGLQPEGYGKFWFAGQTIGAHRFAYVLAHGPIPDGLHLDHLCRVRRCVAPLHLEAVTPAENNHRGVGITAANRRKTHCPRGHEYNERNTYVCAQGKRTCRRCHAIREYARTHGGVAC